MFDKQAWLERLLGPGKDEIWERLKAEGAAAACCSVQWRDNDIAFRCAECEADRNCVVCPQCFFGGDHAGHTVSLIRTSGGCCDCGDPSSWKPEGFCSRHRGITDEEDSELALNTLPPELRRCCETVVSEAVGLADRHLEQLARSVDSAEESQEDLHACLRWLRSLGEVSFGLRYVVRMALAPRLRTWIQRAVTCKTPREAEILSDFFMAIVQQSPRLKSAFAAICLDLYEELGYDSDGDTSWVVASLTVQLFTVPEVALALCRDHDMVKKVCDFLVRCMSRGGPEGVPTSDAVMRQILRICSDLRYVFHHDVVGDLVLRHEESRRAIIRVLSCIWHLHPQKRQVGEHVLYESQVYASAFRIDGVVEAALRPLEAAARRLPWPKAAAWYAELLAALREAVAAEPGRAGEDGQAADEHAHAAERFSFHIRLLRFLVQSLPLSALLSALCGQAAEETASLSACGPCNPAVAGAAGEGVEDARRATSWLALFSAEDASLMLRAAVRPYVLGAEARAGLWKRNGDCLRLQAEHYGSNGWQAEDILAVQVATVLLGMHARAPPAAAAAAADALPAEPFAVLWAHMLEGRAAAALDAPQQASIDLSPAWLRSTWTRLLATSLDDRDIVRVETFWELLARVANETWLADVCEARRGTMEYAGEAAREALARWIVHILAPRPLSASELDRLLPQGWHEHPAKDEVLRAVALAKSSEDGVTKFELKPECWRLFDSLLITDGQRQAPEAEENGMKQKADLLGPSREESSCQAWRDALFWAWCRAPLVPLLRDLFRARGLAQRLQRPVPFPAAFPWALKILDLAQLSRHLGAGGSEQPVALLADLAHLVREDGTEVEVPIAACEAGAALSFRDDIGGALQGLREAGVLAYLCQRVLARSKQAEQTRADNDEDAKQQAKRRHLAARQRNMLQAMAARQQSFIGTAGEADESEEEQDGQAAVLYCDVCREPASIHRPVCLLAHSARSNVLQRLVQHNDFGRESPAVSSCGHVMHMDCFQRHQEHCKQQMQRQDIFSLSRPGPGCVPCPMCRAIVSMALPVLPQGPSFREEAAEVARPDKQLVPIVKVALKGFGKDRSGLVEATALQVLTTSAISPARVVPGDGAPPLHAVLLRLLGLVSPQLEVSGDEGLAGRDPKHLLLGAIGGFPPPRDFRRAAERLTAVRIQQLTGSWASSDECISTREAKLSERLAPWLVFVAWVATGIWGFEARELNLLAHLPGCAAARAAALVQLLFCVDLGALVARAMASAGVLGRPGMLEVHDAGRLVSFAPLPQRLLDLIQALHKRPCAQCGAVPREPCICLLCGAIVCAGNDACSPEGAAPAQAGHTGSCEKHAQVCGASQGLFLAPYWGKVVAISGPMLDIWEYPYVDGYGEPVPPTVFADVSLDARRLEHLRTVYSTGTVSLEIMRHNQRTQRYMRGRL